uniref:Uncharacterized protein n=1 Tax=Magnetospirillum gryphiswaldense TaxID=55518 RepID=A4TVR3_9PROT|nr:hypothetical protein MGR_0863 [Magnetospirillum gryphiswaldense MSR-1]
MEPIAVGPQRSPLCEVAPPAFTARWLIPPPRRVSNSISAKSTCILATSWDFGDLKPQDGYFAFPYRKTKIRALYHKHLKEETS